MRICINVCSLRHDYDHFCCACSPTDSTRMTSWCKWCTRERRCPLNYSRHNWSWTWLKWMTHLYIRWHTCAPTCMHAQTHTTPHSHMDTPHAPSPTCAHPRPAHGIHWFILVISRLLKLITRKSCKSIWTVPMKQAAPTKKDPSLSKCAFNFTFLLSAWTVTCDSRHCCLLRWPKHVSCMVLYY